MVGFVALPKASEFGGPLGGAFRCSPHLPGSHRVRWLIYWPADRAGSSSWP